MIEDQFHIRVVETDLEHRQSPFPYAQKNTLDQFAAFTAHLFACNCLLKRMTYTHEVKREYWVNPTREHIVHIYYIRCVVSAKTEEDMTRLKSTMKEMSV